MNETNDTRRTGWKNPIKGWAWWAVLFLLVVGLSLITWNALSLVNSNPYELPSAFRAFLSIGIAVFAVAVLWVAVRCFSSWRNFKRALVVLACLFGLVALFYGEEDLRGWLSWNLFRTHWAAKGEKFDLAAFIPPPVAEEQNFAMAPVVAGSYSRLLDQQGRKLAVENTNAVDRLRMPLDFDNDGPANAIGNWQKATLSDLEPWQSYYRDLYETTNVFPIARQQQTPAADVLLALSKYDPTIDELRRAAALPGSRFPINYGSDDPSAILLPHLAPLKSCAVALRLRALAEVKAGHSQAAMDDVCLALDLTEKIRSEPFLISQLVRIAMFQLTVQPIWEGLAEHRWNEAQLVHLDEQLAKFNFIADYQASMRAENACQVATMDFLRHRPSMLDRIGDGRGKEPFRLSELGAYLIPAGWFYQNERNCSKFLLEQFMPVGDVGRQTVSPSRVRQANQALYTMRSTPYTLICKMFLPALGKASHRFAFAQATVNLARTASALERFRLGSGKYPDALALLTPQFIAKVPPDPIGGRPLQYRLSQDGQFILYSVGWNERDDGGFVLFTKSGSVDLDNGDWVWRYSGVADSE
jgi:hypothetical protein